MYSLLLGWRGRVGSGIGLARLMRERDRASSYSRGWVMQVTGLSCTKWSVPMSYWIVFVAWPWFGRNVVSEAGLGVVRRPLEGFICLTRHAFHKIPTRTTRTRHTLSLSSCLHYLSVCRVPLVSCSRERCEGVLLLCFLSLSMTKQSQ